MSFYMLGKDLSWRQDKDEAEDLRKCHIIEDSKWKSKEFQFYPLSNKDSIKYYKQELDTVTCILRKSLQRWRLIEDTLYQLD